MSQRSMVGTLGAHWCVVISGALLSRIMAALAFNLVPPVYASSGVAMLVLPRQPQTKENNPFLHLDPTLTTTAAMMMQSLNGLMIPPNKLSSSGVSFSIKNQGTDGSVSENGVQPFVYFDTQAKSPADSVTMVSRLMDIARQDLLDRQKSLQVRPGNYIKLETVVGPSEPKYVVGNQVAAAGGTLLVGVALTVGLILIIHRAWSHSHLSARVEEPAGTRRREAWAIDSAATQFVVASSWPHW
jgi:hypothetical protein